MRRLFWLLGLGVLCLFPSGRSQQKENWIVIRAALLIDGVSDRAISNAMVLIRNDRIEKVGTNLEIPPGAATVDLPDKTVLPGLIDAHTHILLQPEDERVAPVLYKSQAYRTVQGVAAARKDLEAGFTTIRDVDSEGAGFADVAIRDGINSGVIAGPRMQVATLAITITAGHMNNSGLNPDVAIPDPAALADSPTRIVEEIPCLWGHRRQKRDSGRCTFHRTWDDARRRSAQADEGARHVLVSDAFCLCRRRK